MLRDIKRRRADLARRKVSVGSSLWRERVSVDKHGFMIQAEDAGVGRRGRRRRSVSEKLQIVQLTMEPGASVAEIARVHGVNANQVFTWRRLFENGQLSDAGARSTALLPVTISADAETVPESADSVTDVQTSRGGAIHIELPGRANISVESSADLALLRCVLESLRK